MDVAMRDLEVVRYGEVVQAAVSRGGGLPTFLIGEHVKFTDDSSLGFIEAIRLCTPTCFIDKRKKVVGECHEYRVRFLYKEGSRWAYEKEITPTNPLR